MLKNMRFCLLSVIAGNFLVGLFFAGKCSAAPTTKKWTFAVYLDADNNLEDAGVADFLEMAKNDHSSDVNVVVQMDRAPGYDSTNGDWKTCKRFEIKKGMKPVAASQLSDLGESNMGSPATLTTFIKWVKTNYPAEKYALVLWNHGGGWRARGNGNSPMMRAVCWDDSNNDDCLYMKEVRTAIEDSGVKMDLIGFDACLMGHVEVAYELKGVLASGGVVVGSEETEPGEGWPYDTILPNLTGSTSAEGLGQIITQKHGAFYGAKAECTQSCSKVSQISNVVTKLNAFAEAMSDNSKLSAIQKARTSMKAFSEADGYFGLDLYKFADAVGSNASGTTAKDLKDAIDAAMVEVYAGTARQGSYTIKNKGGLCVYFPKSKSDYDSAYGTQILYGSESAGKWDDFLKRYYAGNLGTGSGSGGTTDTSALSVTAKLSKKSVVINKKYTSMTYTLTPVTGSLGGGKVKVLIPGAGWQSPQNAKPKGEGYVKAYIYKSKTKSYPLTISVSGQEITISGIPSSRMAAKSGDQLKLVYYKFYTKQASGSAVFRTYIASSGGSLTEIPKNPSISVGTKLAPGDDESDVDDEMTTEDGEVKTATLGQNFPNPFNPATTFSYYIPESGRVTIRLYNVAGQEVDTVIDSDQVEGEHTARYDSGDKLSRGIYYYRLTLNGKEVGTKRAVVLK
jgi:hypothetical protein